jgi:hypothetical protein
MEHYQRMVQMIYNKHLDRLQEIPFVREFIQAHRMRISPCGSEECPSIVLYRMPYVIEFYDALIDDSLDIFLIEPTSNLMIPASRASGLCMKMGLQKAEDLDNLNFAGYPHNSIFLSSGEMKMLSLHIDLGALDKLLPLLEDKGGLSSMRDGTFDKNFDFSKSAQPLPPGMSKDRYTRFMIEI